MRAGVLGRSGKNERMLRPTVNKRLPNMTEKATLKNCLKLRILTGSFHLLSLDFIRICTQKGRHSRGRSREPSLYLVTAKMPSFPNGSVGNPDKLTARDSRLRP